MDRDLIEQIQAALNAKGFDAGDVDGIFGRRTRNAVIAFQTSEKLPIKFPGTVGQITLNALLPEAPTTAANHTSVAAPWFDLALRYKGLHEGRDYAAVSKFLKSDGKTLGDPRDLPWCGDFVQTIIALTLPNEVLPSNPYLARNWSKFGIEAELQRGAVVNFWRGKRTGTFGHVATLAGISKNRKTLYILGGNQSNTISVVPISIDRLLDCRWPKTYPLPASIILPVMVGGKISVNEA